MPGVRVEKQFHDDCGRVVVCQINIGDGNLTLCNVYGPNNDNPDFFFCKMHRHFERVFCFLYYGGGGDFNTVLNPVLDKFGGREKSHARARMSICNLINQLNLTDIWRDQHGNIRNYTWKSSSKPPKLCRFDYFVISKPLWSIFMTKGLVVFM